MIDGLYYFFVDETPGAIVASIILAMSLPVLWFCVKDLGTDAWLFAKTFVRSVIRYARKDR